MIILQLFLNDFQLAKLATTEVLVEGPFEYLLYKVN